MFRELLEEWLNSPAKVWPDGDVVSVHDWLCDFADFLDSRVPTTNAPEMTVGDSSPLNIRFPDESAVAWFCECEHENMHFWALEECPNCKKQRPSYTVTGVGS